MDDALRERIERLPLDPGCYVFKGEGGKVLYVGKAVSLRARVRSYFYRTGDSRIFIPYLESLLEDVEVLVVRSEKEALILENELIKKLRPRFNVMLRDDKNFLHLRIDPRGEYPRVEVVRRMADDGARYFGPFHSASAIRRTLHLVNKHFLLRTCTDHVLHNRVRPCLQFQIHRCLGPCVYDIDEALYAQQVTDVVSFLEGKGADLVADLRRRMDDAARGMSFEVAAVYRDQIDAVQRSLEKQSVVSPGFANRDVFGMARAAGTVCLQVLQIRHGRLVETDAFHFDRVEIPDDEVVASLVQQYYAGTRRDLGIPPEVLVPALPPESGALGAWLAELRGAKVELAVPARGERRRLLELSSKNAEAALAERIGRAETRLAALERLQARLKLRTLPRRIECYDISTLAGTGAVGSMAVVTDGEVDRRAHRRFRIKTVQGQDDFKMMYEVLARRFRRGVHAADGEQKSSFADRAPDLLLIDGGKGQLNVAVAVLRDLDVTNVDVAALAKEHEKEGPPDRVFLPGVKNPIPLRPNTPELFILARARDEAHRVAVGYQRERRRKERLRSGLDEVAGIGPRRRAALLRHFGSMARVRAATREELAQVPGLGPAAAASVFVFLHPEAVLPPAAPATAAAAAAPAPSEDVNDP
jgi:excinuclease ABC subunit C